MDAVPPQVWVLPRDLTAAFVARGHVERACAGMPEETVYTARLLVTELVSNALQHASGAVLLAIAREGGSVRVHVYDGSPHLPVVSDGPSLMEHGAGLRLVVALSSSWGTDGRVDGQPGKGVWFELP